MDSQLCFQKYLYLVLHFIQNLLLLLGTKAWSIRSPVRLNIVSILAGGCACACGWCAQGGIGKNKTWRQGCVCLHPNLIRQNCLQPCPERLRAAFDDCGLIFRHLISVSKCMNLSVGLGRITPLLIIFAVGFPLMFLMCPLAL